MSNKLKFVQHFQAKTAEGNREITFLANSGKQMASGETVDLQTLQVRDPSSNELVFVKDVKSNDVQNWMPLLKDHVMSIDAKIGEVRALWLSDDGLMMTAKLANTESADNIYQLAKDDMLDTFSITVGFNEQPENGVIKNSQLLETSVVWLGNDMSTKMVSVNEAKEQEMDKEAVKQNELTADEAKTLNDAVSGIQDAVKALQGLVGDDSKPADDSGDAGSQDTPAEPSQNMQKVAQNVIKNEATAKMAHQTVTVVSNGSSYLKSNQALKDFRDILVNNPGERQRQNAWTNKLRSFGISGDILPTSIEQIFFQTWNDSDSVLSTFRNSSAKMLDLNAFTGSGEGIRAQGHKKGEVKRDQVVQLINRTARAKGVYKKLPIDLQDIFDDQTGELVRFRAQELATRVANEIVVSALVGDGRQAPAEGAADYRTFDGTRGLWNIADDIANSSQANSYSSYVATEITPGANDALYESALKALGQIRTNGRKVLILPYGAVTDILLTKNANSTPVFYPGTGIETIFPNTRVFELDEMNDARVGYQAIAYAENSYVLNGDASGRVFTDFDITTNTDVMEVVRYVGGSLQGWKVAAGVKKPAAQGGAGA